MKYDSLRYRVEFVAKKQKLDKQLSICLINETELHQDQVIQKENLQKIPEEGGVEVRSSNEQPPPSPSSRALSYASIPPPSYSPVMPATPEDDPSTPVQTHLATENPIYEDLSQSAAKPPSKETRKSTPHSNTKSNTKRGGVVAIYHEVDIRILKYLIFEEMFRA